MINWPIAAEILAVNGELEQLGIELADVVKDIVEFVVELDDECPRVKERLVEEGPWIFARDWDIFGEEISPPAVPGELSIEVDAEVRAMDLLRGHPLNLLVIVAELSNLFDELIASGQLERRVLLEDKRLIDHHLYLLLLLLLHNILQFFYI